MCAKLYGTVSSMDRSRMLTPMQEMDFFPVDAPDENTILVDPSVQGQPILGFGANWTDTDLYNLTRMSQEQQDRVLEALFDPETGAGWNFMRVPFGSTDWERNFDFYSYDDIPEGEKDWNLEYFSVQRDIDRGLFSMLRRVRDRYPQVRLLASVWGLPGWMKSNDNILGGIFLPEYSEVYATYLRKAVQAFAEQGIELYAITIQNEPLSSDQPNYNRGTPCTRFTWRLQKGVLLALAKEFKEYGIQTKIWAYDHNFDMADIFVDPLLRDAEARAVIDGIAFHPYRGDPAVMDRYTAAYPDMPLFSTEKTVADPAGMDELLRQLRHGARSYVLWNFCTDEFGGPHQLAGNPFPYNQLDPKTSICVPLQDAEQWEKTGAYGLFAQFSKYLKRGMRRIDCTYGHKRWITATAFMAEDRSAAVVTVNQTAQEQSFRLQYGGLAADCCIPPMSVATYCFAIDPQQPALPIAAAPRKKIEEKPIWDLTPVDFWFDQEAVAGEEIRFHARVRNVGTAPTVTNLTSVVEFLLDGDYRAAKSYDTVPILAPGEEAVFTAKAPIYDASGTGCKSTWTATAGWHTIMAFMTVGGSAEKENPYNNRCSKEFFFAERKA